MLASTAFADGSITLSPDGSTSTDASVRIDGQTVTITQAGTYQIAGTLDDGALIVESAENAKIALVLGGVSIKNSTGAAIQIATADDVTIELAEGTTNVLQSGEEVDIATATESKEASGGALQSKADLKIKGRGSLTVLRTASGKSRSFPTPAAPAGGTLCCLCRPALRRWNRRSI